MQKLAQAWMGILPIALAGCTAVVTPPGVVADPVTVFVLQEARHVGLVLPDREAPGYVEFGFGDFDWYAVEDDGLPNVAATVLWPTPGTLVRRKWSVRQNSSLLQLAWFCTLQPLVVDRQVANRLAARLQHEFDSAREGPLAHAGSALQFVPSDSDYWLLYNCNDAVAGWLRELGCSRSWVPICVALQVQSR